MFNTEGILKKLNDVPGVHQSLIVGRDGFVISHLGDMEADSVGAVISTAIGAIEAMGRDCRQGNLFEVMAEYNGGVVIAAPIRNDAVLGVVADESANLGGVRFVVKKSIKELEQAL
ncbi:MAG: roadblock/LC7 domain-containing protein [Deltaproteobacteria bacterium]|nr:roadblock/LC7 domain-containing protein [Deltaproteobacteria bacterium]